MSPGGSGSERYQQRYYWKALLYYALSPIVLAVAIAAIVFPGIATYAIILLGAMMPAWKKIRR